MLNDTDFLTGLLEQNLGGSRKRFFQLSFDCPRCDEGGKKNLEININENSNKYLIFHCWSCHYKGHVSLLLKEYSINNSWEHIAKYQISSKVVKDNKEENKPQKIELPSGIIPYYLDEKAKEYLVETRGFNRSCLDMYNISYNSEKKELIFPFFNDCGELNGYCTHSLKNLKYKNHGKLNYVPYKNKININYPITLTEGIYDCYSGVNAIPFLGTEINESILKFCQAKDVILALDYTVKKNYKEKMISALIYYGARNVVELQLFRYKDLNDLYLKNRPKLLEEYKNLWRVLSENNSN